MARMEDSVNYRSIDPNVAIVAGYINGIYAWSATAWASFPNSKLVRISITASANDGDVLDVETGDATPDQAPGWVRTRRASGHTWPTVYCNLSTWPSVIAAFDAQGVPQPYYWIAAYDNNPTIPAGAVAKQYQGNVPGINGGIIDVSITNDIWPDVNGPPAPPTPSSNSIYFADLGLELPMSLFKSDIDAGQYLVDRWYQDYLHRAPESTTSRDWWVNEISTKGVTVAFEEFAGSAEYKANQTRLVETETWGAAQFQKPAGA